MGRATSDTSAAPSEIATVDANGSEPALDAGVPAGMAGGGEQHGGEDEGVHEAWVWDRRKDCPNVGLN